MPLKAAIICTPRRAKWTILAVLIASFFINLPYFFKIRVTIEGKLCLAFSDKGEFSVGFSWFLTTINCFIPFTLLLVMNSIIVHALRNRVSNFEADHDTTNDNRNRQLTITLLSVTFAFIILCAPQYLRYVTYNMKSYTTSPKEYAGSKFRTICGICYVINLSQTKVCPAEGLRWASFLSYAICIV